MTASMALFAVGVAASATGVERFRKVDVQCEIVPSATLTHLWIALAVVSPADGSWLFARLARAYPGVAAKGEATKCLATVEVQDYACDFGDMLDDHRLALIGLRHGREDEIVASFDSTCEASALCEALGRQKRTAVAAAIRAGSRLEMYQAFVGHRYLGHGQPGRMLDLSTCRDFGSVRLQKVGEPRPMRIASE